MITLYANVLNIRLTPTELLIEAGSFFPDDPNATPPDDLKPEVRLVINRSLLSALSERLQEAAAASPPAAAAPLW